jgi:hypothetical protein
MRRSPRQFLQKHVSESPVSKSKKIVGELSRLERDEIIKLLLLRVVCDDLLPVFVIQNGICSS